MLLVQQYLETKTFGELAVEHGVYASFSKSGHKFSLNYDQIEAKESDPLAQECRGLVLACEDGQYIIATGTTGFATRDATVPGKTRILAYPMRRFFNYGQGSAANINWSDPKLAVLEKLDGTLCIVYYDPFTKQWCVATRSVPEADLLMDNGIFTFRTLFEKALLETCGKDFNEFTSGLNTKITYCFELTTPYNRIVVYYPEPRITLLAARALYGDLEEFDFSNLGGMGWVKYDNLSDSVKEHLTSLGHDAKDTPEAFVAKPHDLWGVPVVQAHTYTSVPELLDWVSSLNPMEHEGVVIRDANFNRIKVKNAAYVAASKIRESLATSPRNCLELILLGKDDDAASFLPQEIQANLASLKERFVIWLKKQEELVQIITAEARSVAPDKKTFALTVQKYNPSMPAMFYHIYNEKANSAKDFIEKSRKDGTWPDSFIDKILSVI